MNTRKLVVEEALTWLRTPYHHRGRVKGVGVDCANLPAAVYEAVGLIPRVDPDYSFQWMMHRDEELFLAHIKNYAFEVEFSTIKEGDLIVWKFGRTFSHSAIVVDYPLIIHAVNHVGVVLADAEQDNLFQDRKRKLFSLWEV